VPALSKGRVGITTGHARYPELDVLAEQSFVLEERLRSAGCQVLHEVYPGATHSFLEAMSVAPLALKAIRNGASWIRTRLI
jgi:acetyl esterase